MRKNKSIFVFGVLLVEFYGENSLSCKKGRLSKYKHLFDCLNLINGRRKEIAYI